MKQASNEQGVTQKYTQHHTETEALPHVSWQRIGLWGGASQQVFLCLFITFTFLSLMVSPTPVPVPCCKQLQFGPSPCDDIKKGFSFFLWSSQSEVILIIPKVTGGSHRVSQSFFICLQQLMTVTGMELGADGHVMSPAHARGL